MGDLPENEERVSNTHKINYLLRSKRPASGSPEDPSKPATTSNNNPRHKKKQKQQKQQTNMDAKKFDDFIKRMDAFSQATSFQLNGITGKIDSLDSKLEKLQKKTDILEEKQDQAAKNIDWLYNEMSSVQIELNQVRQATLANDFVINGIPSELMPQLPQDALILTAAAVGLVIESKDIKQISERKHKQSKTSRVMVSLHNGLLKQKLMEKVKSQNPLLVKDVFVNVPENSPNIGKQIKIFNQLTPTNRRILVAAQRVNNGSYKYIWEKTGRILIKKDENARVIEIRSTQQLMNIFGPNVFDIFNNNVNN
ncbi:CLUMA_CG011821, isoform A [Clunio marinus]|uniref:CLUMA_CG011821, isoform A n=1 Tax=Clunio marinus TaxID=568069 RepID=A0A1J1IE27_9DIPT|nr:CLUMA_CG011821, isoform A [Clunio marinus]